MLHSVGQDNKQPCKYKFPPSWKHVCMAENVKLPIETLTDHPLYIWSRHSRPINLQECVVTVPTAARLMKIFGFCLFLGGSHLGAVYEAGMSYILACPLMSSVRGGRLGTTNLPYTPPLLAKPPPPRPISPIYMSRVPCFLPQPFMGIYVDVLVPGL